MQNPDAKPVRRRRRRVAVLCVLCMETRVVPAARDDDDDAVHILQAAYYFRYRTRQRLGHLHAQEWTLEVDLPVDSDMRTAACVYMYGCVCEARAQRLLEVQTLALHSTVCSCALAREHDASNVHEKHLGLFWSHRAPGEV
jgi:hypothetical protein